MTDTPPTYPPDQPTMAPPKVMTVARMLSELAGEPAATTIELAIVDHRGTLFYVVPLADNDAWWVRDANALRLVGRLPKSWTEPEPPVEAEATPDRAYRDPATVEAAEG